MLSGVGVISRFRIHPSLLPFRTLTAAKTAPWAILRQESTSTILTRHPASQTSPKDSDSTCSMDAISAVIWSRSLVGAQKLGPVSTSGGLSVQFSGFYKAKLRPRGARNNDVSATFNKGSSKSPCVACEVQYHKVEVNVLVYRPGATGLNGGQRCCDRAQDLRGSPQKCMPRTPLQRREFSGSEDQSEDMTTLVSSRCG
jgi:hypothetical protein